MHLSSKKSRLKYHPLGMSFLLLLGGLYAFASFPLCKNTHAPPALLSSQYTQAPVQVGAAKAEISIPHWPVAMAGYGPLRPKATEQSLPLYARAIVLRSSGFELSLLSLETLLVPPALTQKLQQQLGEVVVVPTHTHSSLGGFDARWQAQISTMGRFEEAVYEAVLEACLQAVAQARQNLQEAHFAWEQSQLEAWTQPRSGTQVESRLLRLRWQSKAGPLAQVLVLAAHPTLAPKSEKQLHPDFPGELALLEEGAGHGVTLVWPSAVANARISLPHATPQSFAQKLHAHVQAWPPPPVENSTPLQLSYARIRFALPAVDTSRLVPKLLSRPANNLLCQGIPPEAEFSVLALGALQLVAVPFEVGAEAARALEEAGLGHALSMANNYLGYMETPGNVEQSLGESSLQYFEKTLLEKITQAAQLRPWAGP
ncbi:MAG: neutral/alkaline non-lysosomal ceramidase N-terminal domain-containing protein [Cystobacterineae bacterium]|nr:neutral/alkaline non-lysosomal ceramidase N-terminal domain-containing protein [Cystobacterineae bacterium]